MDGGKGSLIFGGVTVPLVGVTDDDRVVLLVNCGVDGVPLSLPI